MASPLVLPATGWLGIDGNWSTFALTAGSPPQQFHILPSTTTSELWLPLAEGCVDQATCSATRGGIFESNASSSWQQLGLYELPERTLYPGENGLYGLDVATIGSHTVDNQTIAGIASRYFWVGSLGLANNMGSFSSVDYLIESPLQSLSDHAIPSTSYSYTAGAAYRNIGGSLVLGGYDSEGVSETVSLKITSNGLLINLAGIVATNTLSGTAALVSSSNGLTMRIDSTVAQLWLPITVCDQFQKAFGLVYESSNNLYLINSTTRSALQQRAAQLTFNLATGPSSGTTTNIVLPYSAFDLQIGQPIFNTTYFYFPIARAANESQYVLGRTFLQEAYLIVDYERQNFSIGQAKHNSASNIVTIQSTKATAPTHVPLGGIIGGSVAGGFLVVVIVAVWVYIRRRGRAMARVSTIERKNEVLPEPESSDRKSLSKDLAEVEAGMDSVHELGVTHYELGTRGVYELNGALSTELPGSKPHELPGAGPYELAAHR